MFDLFPELDKNEIPKAPSEEPRWQGVYTEQIIPIKVESRKQLVR